jgi:hypothetical protein
MSQLPAPHIRAIAAMFGELPNEELLLLRAEITNILLVRSRARHTPPSPLVSPTIIPPPQSHEDEMQLDVCVVVGQHVVTRSGTRLLWPSEGRPVLEAIIQAITEYNTPQ